MTDSRDQEKVIPISEDYVLASAEGEVQGTEPPPPEEASSARQGLKTCFGLDVRRTVIIVNAVDLVLFIALFALLIFRSQIEICKYASFEHPASTQAR